MTRQLRAVKQCSTALKTGSNNVLSIQWLLSRTAATVAILQSWTKIVGTLVLNCAFLVIQPPSLPLPLFSVVLL